MTYKPASIEDNLPDWINKHPSKDGWGYKEWSILRKRKVSVSFLVSLWGKNRKTIDKYIEADNKYLQEVIILQDKVSQEFQT
jgi:hypothetical protein